MCFYHSCLKLRILNRNFAQLYFLINSRNGKNTAGTVFKISAKYLKKNVRYYFTTFYSR